MSRMPVFSVERFVDATQDHPLDSLIIFSFFAILSRHKEASILISVTDSLTVYSRLSA
jgi:hypothetical protein